MKLKALLMSVVCLFAAVTFVACGNKEAATSNEPEAITVDSVFANARNLLGDTIEIKGMCSHLCSHGGTKAFLVGSDSTQVLRCQATPEMGGAFAPDCAGKELIVKGIVCESRIGEEEVAQMEARMAASDSSAQAHEACDTEKKAAGQANLNSFAQRMADYRAKIAARTEAEGIPYLSFYYIEALGYTIEGAEEAAE